jgi:hypothetical protein
MRHSNPYPLAAYLLIGFLPFVPSACLALPSTNQSGLESLTSDTVSPLEAKRSAFTVTDKPTKIASRQSVSKFQKSEEGQRLLATVQSVVHRLPSQLVSQLVKAGIRIAVVPNMDCIPRHIGDDYFDTTGLFWRDHLIVIPQKVFSSNSLLDNDEVEFSALHEIGHAFDSLKGDLSQTHDFKSFYATDYGKLNQIEKSKIAYLVEGYDDMSRCQLFAEVFALVYAFQIGVEPQNRQLEWDFPNCYAYIRDRVPKFHSDSQSTESVKSSSQ